MPCVWLRDAEDKYALVVLKGVVTTCAQLRESKNNNVPVVPTLVVPPCAQLRGIQKTNVAVVPKGVDEDAIRPTFTVYVSES